MQDSSYAAWFQQWAAGMDSAPGGKVPMGPVEALASKSGRARPKRSAGAGRVPPLSAGQVKKAGPSG
jgi:hypothetical protein